MTLKEKADAFDKCMHNVLTDMIPIQAFLMSNYTPSDLMISTITMYCKPCSIDKKIDVMDFRLFIEKENMIPEKYCIKEPKKGKRAFRNCIIFSAEQPSRKVAIKVFSNLSLHITGVKTINDAIEITKPIWECLALYMSIQEFDMSEFQIQMINSNFSINKSLDLQKMKSTMECSCHHMIVHNKETHPGLVVKFQSEQSNQKVTIIVFTSGNIIITGAKNATDLYEAYCFITNFIDNNFDKVELCGEYIPRKRKGGEKKKPGRKKKCDTASFYDALLL